MKKYFAGTLFLVFLTVAFSCKFNRNSKPLESILFDEGWTFILADSAAFSKNEYNDSHWRQLNLPHDWSIEGTYDQMNPSSRQGGYMPGGIGWYRKKFQLRPEWENKKITLVFDGVYMNSTVYINGDKVGTRPYGYSTFAYNITRHIRRGINTISVRIDNSRQPSGRWYTGCGIYRHVWLKIDNKLCLSHNGVFITTPEIKENESIINIESTIENSGNKKESFNLEQRIINNRKKTVLKITDGFELTPKEKKTFVQFGKLNNISKWSAENPVLYSMITSIYKNGKLIDYEENNFGFREIETNPSTGLWINKKKIKLKGVCLHHDAGNLGAAVPEDVLYRRLRILKEMGCNALRTSHNPFAPEFYDMCDSMGFMVLNEAFDGWDKKKADFDYGLFFKEWWERDLTDFIKRDRNHPSVIMWSLGNEVRGRTDSIERLLFNKVKKLDPTRPVTIGAGHDARIVDVAGFNGKGENPGTLEKIHRDHPDWPVLGTELPHTWQTRGVYRTKTWIRGNQFAPPWNPSQKGIDPDTSGIFYLGDLTEHEVFTGIDSNYLSSYDNAYARIFARKQWERTSSMDFFMGEFRWTGFDYLGENIFPNRGWHCGIVDLCGFPKDLYFFYKSVWTDTPMVHMLPHWSHPGKNGIEIPVMVYSNCEEVELFLNGQGLGVRKAGSDFLWNVKYIPGTLKAEGKVKGKTVVTQVYTTAGSPFDIDLIPDRNRVPANGTSVCHLMIRVVDSTGYFVPDAGNIIHLDIEGPGEIVAMENGDMLDHTPAKAKCRKVFNGLAMAYIKSSKKPGIITITANSENLKSSSIQIETY